MQDAGTSPPGGSLSSADDPSYSVRGLDPITEFAT
jgi:hypothetical protein